MGDFLYILIMKDKVILTEQGFEKLQKELSNLSTKERPKELERLKKARDMGDLSENSAYLSARENLRFVDRRMGEIETILSSAKVIKKDRKSSQVKIGDTVEVKVDGRTQTYIIVGEAEADMAKKRLSYTSPTGKALLGAKKGDRIEVKTPAGQATYLVTNIK